MINKKSSESAKKRWATMSDEEKRELRRLQAEGMKRFWSSLSKEQKMAISRKREETRKARKVKRDAI